MKELLKIGVVALIAALIGGFVAGQVGGDDLLGGVTNFDSVDVTDGYLVDGATVINGSGNVAIGSGGTTITKLLTGTCNLSTGTATIAATSSGAFYCAITGVASGDNVFVSLPIGAASTYAGIHVVAAYATSSNMIGVNLANFTGVATSSYSQATTSVAYWISDI